MKFLYFVEECVLNPRYFGYIGGRIEVIGDGPFAEREIRLFTRRLREFGRFRDKWDWQNVTDKQLARIERTVETRFFEEPD
jgi:hypothetical protein